MGNGSLIGLPGTSCADLLFHGLNQTFPQSHHGSGGAYVAHKENAGASRAFIVVGGARLSRHGRRRRRSGAAVLQEQGSRPAVRWKRRNTDAPKGKRGTKVYRQLSGAARSAADEIPVEEIVKETG